MTETQLTKRDRDVEKCYARGPFAGRDPRDWNGEKLLSWEHRPTRDVWRIKLPWSAMWAMQLDLDALEDVPGGPVIRLDRCLIHSLFYRRINGYVARPMTTYRVQSQHGAIPVLTQTSVGHLAPGGPAPLRPVRDPALRRIGALMLHSINRLASQSTWPELQADYPHELVKPFGRLGLVPVVKLHGSQVATARRWLAEHWKRGELPASLRDELRRGMPLRAPISGTLGVSGEFGRQTVSISGVNGRIELRCSTSRRIGEHVEAGDVLSRMSRDPLLIGDVSLVDLETWIDSNLRPLDEHVYLPAEWTWKLPPVLVRGLFSGGVHGLALRGDVERAIDPATETVIAAPFRLAPSQRGVETRALLWEQGEMILPEPVIW